MSTRLSTPIENLKSSYEVIVIGSGYGGGIAASRLARAGRDVCLLERGREFQPGEYPNTPGKALDEMQASLPGGARIGSRTGLYDFHVNPDINVFVGCGLGGTSLVNANVALEAEPRVWEEPSWPAEVRAAAKAPPGDPFGLAAAYERARQMLRPNPLPDSCPTPAKLQALEASARAMKGDFYRTPINVTFSKGVNHVGVDQEACNGCGDCVSGCNVGAKNTTLMNYLPDASNHGAQIFTEVSVRYLERRNGRWVVHYQWLGSGPVATSAPTQFITADVVVVSAGTLGSTEILLRSRANGLALSPAVGDRFTGNGDVLGFGYNTERTINGIGFGDKPAGAIPFVGPCITGIIDLRRQEVLKTGMVIEEGSIPGCLHPAVGGTLSDAAALIGRQTEPGELAKVRQGLRAVASAVEGAYSGAVKNTQTYLIMSYDDDHGRMVLEEDELRVVWPGVGNGRNFIAANENLFRATQATGGVYVENPTWSKAFNRSLVTVHPLGGCIMAESAAAGVVNARGQVFSSGDGAAVHEGLYVADGSVIPASLGVNPLLTISALAERTVALLAADRGWSIDYRLPSAPRAGAAAAKIGIEFTETMRGFFSVGEKDDFARGEAAGRQVGSSLSFTLTIKSEDLDDMLKSPGHKASLIGLVNAPQLSGQPLTVNGGEFQLFVRDPSQPDLKLMNYRVAMDSVDGKRYLLYGYKTIHDSPVDKLWAETTTLYTTVYNPDGSVLGKGILHILAEDFLKMMTTLRVTGAPGKLQELEAVARFGRYFAGQLWASYGTVFAGPTLFNPKAPAREKRPLAVGPPEVYPFKAADGVELLLTRYRGGPKGPVMLSHGLGVSSLIFSIDTIETNLLEFLFANGYDVWLLDYRASIALPASALQSTGDQVARLDYPAAVALIRRVSGAPTIQAVVHCYGASTFTMAMLAGLEGVRSIVISQISANVVGGKLVSLKTGLHLPSVLDRLGIRSLTALAEKGERWWEYLGDQAAAGFALVAAEGLCASAVCHRITFMYAALYEHSQLNQATHDALHEMFGAANISAFEHIAVMGRKGHVVSACGADDYMPHLERLNLPICFIHGSKNVCFLPQSTAETYDLLRARYGDDRYSRHVIPGYGHIDCIFGRDAHRDVYPHMLAHLEKTASA